MVFVLECNGVFKFLLER